MKTFSPALSRKIRLVSPASLPPGDGWERALQEAKIRAGRYGEVFQPWEEGVGEAGKREERDLLTGGWPLALRQEELVAALQDPHTQVVWCTRGGYGVSELLPLLPWKALRALPPKWVVGFSDASALLSGVYCQLPGWCPVHGPMPASPLWGDEEGALQSQHALERLFQGESLHLPVSWWGDVGEAPPVPGEKGWLFGGNLSVLTNLLGTPYFPPSLEGAFVFFEDTHESPGRLWRFLTQWGQAGLWRGVKALILGDFRHLGAPGNVVKREIARRLPLPVGSTPAVGHQAWNLPLPLGALGELTEEGLRVIPSLG